MQAILLISSGGVLGALSRYYISVFIQQNKISEFPFATFAVNIAGCMFIGFIMRLAVLKPFIPDNMKLFLITGFAGSFTTFSTFGYESCQLILNNNISFFLLNVVLSNFMGLLSIFIGMFFATFFFG